MKACDVTEPNIPQPTGGHKSARHQLQRQNVSTDIVKDLDMTGEVGTKDCRAKATYINNVADLTAMLPRFLQATAR